MVKIATLRLPIAIKRVIVALTRQLVLARGEPFECSQLPELGWDATCEASSQNK